MMDRKLKVLIVEARFYERIQDALLEGAKAALDAFDAEYDVVTVPGALEIPIAISMADEAGQKPAGVRYDGYVALGCVIRGETTHYETVAGESARGLMDLGVQRRLAIGNGVLTVEDEAQAWARARPTEGDKGGGAAKACLELIVLKHHLAGGAR
ncbi:MAG: 6,7-dimethyl-8-ribityllumazine synthase [Caulobacteraceae bacterium]|nr:6,7-dimethyl-8-ribityllumazine synthase [Caulobacteraceae bacterium]